MRKARVIDSYPLASRYYFDEPEDSKIIEWAQNLVERNHSSPCILEFAYSFDSIADLELAIKKYYEESSADFPTRIETGLELAEYYSEKIITKQLEPYEGAKIIWHSIVDQEEFEGEFQELKWFVGLASEFEDFDEIGQREFYGNKKCEELKSKVGQKIIDEAISFRDNRK